METHYTKIYTGNFIVVQLMVSRLEDVGINPILKDNMQTGLKAVLVSNYQGLQEIFVHNDELDKAIPIVETVKIEMEA